MLDVVEDHFDVLLVESDFDLLNQVVNVNTM